MSQYLIDSNFFIEAHRKTYPMDVALGFWDAVKKIADNKQIISINKVKNELYNNEDELCTWCKENLPKEFFHSSDDCIQEYQTLMRWAQTQKGQYKSSAIADFSDRDRADAWLIAYAKKHNLVLITHEVSAPESKKSIKMPDVCIAHSVSYKNTIQMFRELQITF